MICPVCKTKHPTEPNTKVCVQCGSDLYVHSLLQELRQEMQMKNENKIENTETTNTAASDKAHPQKRSDYRIILHTIPSILLLICTLFGFFIGFRFLTFLDRLESHRNVVSEKWLETGLEQVKQLNTIVQQTLDLVLEQRKENQGLRTQIQELSQNNSTAKEPILLETSSESATSGENEHEI